MSSYQSDFTQLSFETNAIFDSIAKRGETKYIYHCIPNKIRLLKLENAEIDEKIQLAVWEAFGKILAKGTKIQGAYIQRQMRGGRSVIISKFGIFTFTHADVDLTVENK
jgi:hypothetical protein